MMTSIDGSKSNKENVDFTCQKIKDSQDEQMQAYGYERNIIKTTITYIACVLTLGLLRLLYHWYPNFYLYSTHKPCGLSKATKVLIIDVYQGKYKTYIVKKVKTVSAQNLTKELLSSNLINTDGNLVESISHKDLRFNLENGTMCKVKEYKTFCCKKQHYVWDEENNEYSRLVGYDRYVSCENLRQEKINGLSKEEQLLRRIIYGFNEILVPVQGFGVLFILEILNPFYVFQNFSLVVWFYENYLYYAVAVIFMAAFGIITSIRQTRVNQKNLRNIVAQTENVCVLRSNGEHETISSNELVPGDIIELPKHRSIVPCDAVLLSGTCVVNESMLTGESLPVMKTPLNSDPVLYDSKEHTHHTLFCGTKIIQTKQHVDKPVLAKVIRTGLWTNKGSLVAAILYPPPIDFKFDQDSYKLIAILIVIAFCGFFYTLAIMIERGSTLKNIIIKTLTVFTIAIPPALPSVMAVGKMYAIFRLVKRQIRCMNTRAINKSGSIDCVCFDKTGTLTEDGLDMMCVVVNDGNQLRSPEKNIQKINDSRLFKGMLVCHSLTLIDNELSGDPLDLKMFESTGWELEEPETTDSTNLQALSVIKKDSNISNLSGQRSESFEIYQQYQFSSTLQRMSVIARSTINNDDKFIAYTKGSPEMILNLSVPESIPGDIMVILNCYLDQGYRVIALASKEINESDARQVQNIPRETVEKDLEFLGLIVLENRLKKPTKEVIQNLRSADIKIVMVTGDNMQTAISVAKKCGIIDHSETAVSISIIPSNSEKKPNISFNIQGLPQLKKTLNASHLEDIEFNSLPKNYKFALTGETWKLLREHYSDLLPKICTRGVVFARMNSDQKQQLIMELIQLDYHVAMCGDGANDCGALRAAHVGISLSEAESSVASPFTSQIPDITCVPIVIQQGRAALATSFGIFKFTVCYSLTELISTIILYSISSNFTGLQFFYVDVLLFVNFAFFFGKTEAYDKQLAREPPPSSLISFTPLFSLAVHTIIIALFELIAFHTVQQFSWFEPFVSTDEFLYDCYENYSVFCLSIFQYATIAITFSAGKPYRKPIYTNKCFILSIIVLTICNVYITLYPAQWVVDLLELRMPPVYDWRFMIVGLGIMNFFLCLGFEYFIIEYLIQQKIKPKLHKPEKLKKKYLLLEHDLKRDSNWPPISKELPNLPITPSYQNILNSNGRRDSKSIISVEIVNENKENIQMSSFSKSVADNLAFNKNLTDDDLK